MRNVCGGDETGGFYIGGGFTKVGSTVRNRVAHILAGRTLDPTFNPDANSPITAIAVSGSTIYLGRQKPLAPRPIANIIFHMNIFLIIMLS